jgi:hypothetical protein
MWVGIYGGIKTSDDGIKRGEMRSREMEEKGKARKEKREERGCAEWRR